MEKESVHHTWMSRFTRKIHKILLLRLKFIAVSTSEIPIAIALSKYEPVIPTMPKTCRHFNSIIYQTGHCFATIFEHYKNESVTYLIYQFQWRSTTGIPIIRCQKLTNSSLCTTQTNGKRYFRVADKAGKVGGAYEKNF